VFSHCAILAREWLCNLVSVSSFLHGWCLQSSLFSTKATPAELPGCVGLLVFMTFNLLPNRISICTRCSVQRWVSWMHRIPILWSLIVWFIRLHFAMRLCPRFSKAYPFIFSIVILMFVLNFFLLLLCLGVFDLVGTLVSSWFSTPKGLVCKLILTNPVMIHCLVRMVSKCI
jgi:hypothetical protein